MKEFSVVINPGQSWTMQELVTQNLVPHLFDSIVLREETVPPHIKIESFIIFRARKPSHFVASFENRRVQIELGQLITRSETGGTGSYDDNLLLAVSPLIHEITFFVDGVFNIGVHRFYPA